MNVGRGRPSVPGPAIVPLTAPSIASIAAAAPGSTRDGLARILRLGLVMLGLTVFSGVFFVTGEAETTARLSRGAVEGSRLVQTTLGLVFLLALVLIACGHLRELGATLWANRWFTALILLCLASTAWSAAPGVSFRRSIALVGQVLTAYAFTRGLRTMDVVRMVLIFYTIITVAAFITRPFAPELVTMQWEQDGNYLFRGFFDHKNSYGRALSQAIVLGAACLLAGSLRAFGAWVAVGTCAIALVASWSKSGMVALTVVLPTYLVLLVCTRPPPLGGARSTRFEPPLRRLPAKPVLLGAASLLGLIAGLGLLLAIQVDTTLTGRTYIWEEAIRTGLRRPLLGHGFGAFWLGDLGASSSLHEALGWTVLSAHNAFIDIWLDLGGLGIVLLAGWLVMLAWRFLARLRREPLTPANAALPFVFVHFLVMAMTGGAYLAYLNVTWFIFLMFFFTDRPAEPSVIAADPPTQSRR